MILNKKQEYIKQQAKFPQIHTILHSYSAYKLQYILPIYFLHRITKQQTQLTPSPSILGFQSKICQKCILQRFSISQVDQERGERCQIMDRVWRFINQFIMRQGDKTCHRVTIKAEKELEGFRRREERHMEGVARIILGKLEGGIQEIWMDELRNEPVAKLKEFSMGERGLWYARTIIAACCGLASYYGFFIINENMVFFNTQREVSVWINPDLLENHIKIYLPHTHEGELAMIRSIISFIKLWLKYDYALLADVKHLPELASKFQIPKRHEGFKPKSPGRQFMGGRRNSVNLESTEVPLRAGQRIPLHGQQLLMQNRSTKDNCRSPNRDNEANFLTSSISNKPNGLKFNQLTAQTEKGDFQHRSFNSNNNIVPLSKSIGMGGNSNYFPNKTTSNKHHIVSMINKLDSGSNDYVKNKLLLDDERMKDLEKDKLRKMKQSLDGIGEELNDLFVSNIENEEEDHEEKKKIEEEFENILG